MIDKTNKNKFNMDIKVKLDGKPDGNKNPWDNMSIRKKTKQRLIKYKNSVAMRPILTDLVSYIVDSWLDGQGFPE